MPLLCPLLQVVKNRRPKLLITCVERVGGDIDCRSVEEDFLHRTLHCGIGVQTLIAEPHFHATIPEQLLDHGACRNGTA